MRSLYTLVLVTFLLHTGVLEAQSCLDQFSVCLTAEASAPTAHGTDACIRQRTACIVAKQKNPSPAVSPAGVSPEPMRRGLMKPEVEPQNPREKQQADRDAQNWREFDGLLRAQKREPQERQKDADPEQKWIAW